MDNKDLDELIDLLKIKEEPTTELWYVVKVNGNEVGPRRRDPEDAESDIRLLSGYHRAIAEIDAIPITVDVLTPERLIQLSKEQSLSPEAIARFEARVRAREEEFNRDAGNTGGDFLNRRYTI